MKALQIIETAYRATIEEQDDTIVWLTHAIVCAGGELDVLLRGDAVNYAVAGQNASGLVFGDWRQTQPPRIDENIKQLLGKGVAVYVAEQDVARMGLAEHDLIPGVRNLPGHKLVGLAESYDHIWHW